MTQLVVGERVVLDCDNPYLDGRPAVVLALTEYGAVVSTGVGSGQWRALLSELVPCREPTRGGCTGAMCGTCGGANMVRSGSCECCLDCGSTSGCS